MVGARGDKPPLGTSNVPASLPAIKITGAERWAHVYRLRGRQARRAMRRNTAWLLVVVCWCRARSLAGGTTLMKRSPTRALIIGMVLTAAIMLPASPAAAAKPEPPLRPALIRRHRQALSSRALSPATIRRRPMSSPATSRPSSSRTPSTSSSQRTRNGAPTTVQARSPSPVMRSSPPTTRRTPNSAST